MCEYQQPYEGCRSYGDNIPGYAQGAFYPEDEPGEKCRFSGEIIARLCESCPHENNPRECHAYAETKTLCPHCLDDAGDRIELYAHKHGHYRCPECGNEYRQAELTAALSELASDYLRRMCDGNALYAEVQRLTEQVELVRRAVA